MRGLSVPWANPITRLRLRSHAFLQLFLLFGMMVILTWTLSDQVRGLQQAWLTTFSALGLGIGWVLARTKMTGWKASIILFFLYVGLMLFRVGKLSESMVILMKGLLATSWEALYLRDFSGFTKLGSLAENSWLEITIPWVRVYKWMAVLISGGTAFDPLVTAILGSALVFSLAAWAAWAVRRREEPLIAYTPAGALLLVILYLTDSPTASLVIFIALALLLSAIVKYRSQISHWDRNGIGYAEDIQIDLFWSVAVLVLVLSLAAHLASFLSIETIIDFSRKLLPQNNRQVDNLAQSIGIDLHSNETNPFGRLYNPGLPRSHLVTSGPDLSTQEVMTVRVEGLSPVPDKAGSLSTPRFYWRGLTYDQYTGRGWRTSQANLSSYPAGEANPTEPAPHGKQISQEINLVGDLEANEENILFAAGTPSNLDQARQVAWRSPEDIFGVTGKTTRYKSTSLVNDVQPSSLRLAGEGYPEWILQRYLPLPDSVPERVRQLAIQLTAAAPTPYDRALAIENYLRAIPYSLEVPAPPPGREVSDYFLFDIKRGYCDYYATAMVVLSRAAGLPARLVMGYASGVYDPNKNLYQVSAADAHSWVEIYFPGTGWITFEPTGGQPAIVRGTTVALPQVNHPETRNEPRLNLPAWFDQRAGFHLLTGFLILAGVTIIGWFFTDRWLLFRVPPSHTAINLYHRLKLQVWRLAIPILPSQTPYEISTELISKYLPLGHRRLFKKIIIPGEDEIAQLTEMYVRSIYSPTPPEKPDQQVIIQAWSRLRWRLWLAKWVRRLQRKAV